VWLWACSGAGCEEFNALFDRYPVTAEMAAQGGAA